MTYDQITVCTLNLHVQIECLAGLLTIMKHIITWLFHTSIYCHIVNTDYSETQRKTSAFCCHNIQSADVETNGRQRTAGNILGHSQNTSDCHRLVCRAGIWKKLFLERRLDFQQRNVVMRIQTVLHTV